MGNFANYANILIAIVMLVQTIHAKDSDSDSVCDVKHKQLTTKMLDKWFNVNAETIYLLRKKTAECKYEYLPCKKELKELGYRFMLVDIKAEEKYAQMARELAKTCPGVKPECSETLFFDLIQNVKSYMPSMNSKIMRAAEETTDKSGGESVKKELKNEYDVKKLLKVNEFIEKMKKEC